MSSDAQALWSAAKAGQIGEVDRHIRACADVDWWNPDQMRFTALMIAARNGHSAVCERLLEACCNVRKETLDGRTALHLAALNGHTEICVLLLRAGADVRRARTRRRRALVLVVVRRPKLSVSDSGSAALRGLRSW
jgi:ankyrin repeat protein